MAESRTSDIARSGKVNILVVDDKPEQLLSVEAVLEELGETIVKAASGQDALRSLLQREFAVILLDINMPGMSGFETASLIRQRRSTRHTPIIFLTAYAENVNIERSYSLGAVDYILTPFRPEVLKAKVAVFVDLFRKTEQIKTQAEALRARAEQLHKLNRAALTITSAESVATMMEAIARSAREVGGAHQAMAICVLDTSPERFLSAASLSDKYAAYRAYSVRPTTGGLSEFSCNLNRPLRLTEVELAVHPEWLDRGEDAPPLRGYLSVPLTGADGRNMGVIELSEGLRGDFSDEDEAALVQLAQLASIAIQSCLHAEAREANRMKDEFLATLSHELRSPLNAILGWTRLLRSGPLDPQRAERGLEVIERNVGVQTRLIEDLLDMSRIATGKLRINPVPVELAPIVEGAADAHRLSAENKQIALHVALEPGLMVDGDPDRLQQVVSNLISNALKFTAGGGRVDVSARRVGGDAQIVVSDTGEGMSPEFLPFIFDRFRQADSSSQRAQAGLGIGLALVRKFVELHGGSVSAESPGLRQGSRFTIRLPALAAGAMPAQVAATHGRRSDAPGSRGGARDLLDGVRVLVVEDDPDAREVIEEVLSQHRATVTAVASVREALQAVDRDAPHVVVSDVAMPGQDGYELIRILRERGPADGGDVPALALTAYAREEDQQRALAAGFQMHAAKPIEPLELVAAVASLATASPRDGGAVP